MGSSEKKKLIIPGIKYIKSPVSGDTAFEMRFICTMRDARHGLAIMPLEYVFETGDIVLNVTRYDNEETNKFLKRAEKESLLLRMTLEVIDE